METTKTYPLKDVLLVASYFTKNEGYHSVASGGDSTKSKVLAYLKENPDTSNLAEYQERAQEAIKWLKEEKDSEWINNIRDALKRKRVEERHVGLLASMFSGYDSYLKKEENKKEFMRSQPQGEVKAPITFNLHSFKLVTSGKSKYNDRDFFLFRLLDFHGNVYVWFADSDYTEQLETCKSINSIVKSHNVHDGVNQTNIDVKEIK